MVRHEYCLTPREPLSTGSQPLATPPSCLARGPDASATAQSTLVVTGSRYGAVSDLWTTAVADALPRTGTSLSTTSSGQQSMLFEQGIGFRPDWEAVLHGLIGQ